MSARIRVVVIDDQQLVRAGLRMIVDAEEDIDVVGEADNGESGLALIASTRPDVALMDIRMPVLDGVDATRRLAAQPDATTRVLVLTTFDTDEAVVAALRAGASGFLLKDTEPEALVRAIRAVAVGDAVVSPNAMRRLLRTSKPSPPEAAPRVPAESGKAPGIGVLAPLTDREVEVLTLMGEGLTNAEIAARLVVAESTAKTHVSRILMKLGARDRVQAVIVAHQAGLVG